MLLQHAACTDVGRMRDHNEDTFAVELGEQHSVAGALFVVCDGMGGYARGEVASDLAAKMIVSHYYAAAANEPGQALTEAFQQANREVFQQGNGSMGTTGIAALYRAGEVIIANVGDCRAYLVRNGQPHQITRDHSFVAEQVAAGVLSAEEAEQSSYRHIITRAIGQQGDVEVDLFYEPLQQGDVVVLCSDGLHGQVSADEIALAVSSVPLDQACRGLIRLANERGGPDNITVVVAMVVELDASGPERETQPLTSRSRTVGGEAAATAQNGTAGNRRARHAMLPAPPPLARVAQPAAEPVWRFGMWLASALLVVGVMFGIYYFARMYIEPTSSLPVVVPPRVTLTPLGGTDAPGRAPAADATPTVTPSPTTATATPTVAPTPTRTPSPPSRRFTPLTSEPFSVFR